MIITNQLLNKVVNGYTLKRNMTITVLKSVIDTLLNIYVKSGERGGIFWIRATSTGSEVFRVSLFENLSKVSYEFQANKFLWDTEIEKIINLGFLPMVFHTHPTNLNLQFYDNRKQNFFIRASAPDRNIAKGTINEKVNLYMPECIFVKDARYTDGYAMAMYGGKILPNGFSRLSTLEFATIGLLGLAFITKQLSFPLVATATGLVVYEETQRPKYSTDNKGNYIIEI